MPLEHNSEHINKPLYVKIEHFHSINIEVFNDIFYICVKIYNDENNNYNNVAIIFDIKYDREKCDIYEELEFGDSFKNFIDSALNIVLQLYPNINMFRISDLSNKNCHALNSFKFTYIEINMYYLLFHGEPWFSKLFKARLSEESQTYIHYTTYLNRINHPYDNFNYEDFKYYLLEYCDKERVIEYINKYDIKELYNQNSDSLYNFFQKLKKAIGDNKKLREFLAPMFPYIMRDIFYRPNIFVLFREWIISANNINRHKVDYTVIDNIDNIMCHNTYKTIIQLRSHSFNLD